MIRRLPACHTENTWDAADATRPYLHCRWCGSMHPDVLIAALAAGATLRGVDWKFGWPHRFTVQGALPTQRGKFYLGHLFDSNWTNAQLIAPLTALQTHTGIQWTRNGNELTFVAPYPGYKHGEGA